MKRSFARIVGPLAAVVAAGLFWLLSHGGASSALSVRGYAEVIDHPVASLQTGRITAVKVTVGQVVKAGDIIATTDSRELELKLETARVALDQATAQLTAADVNARAAVARAELLVVRLKGSANRDQAALAEVKQQLSRLQKLADEQLVQVQEVERAKLQEAQLSASVSMYDQAAQQRQGGLGRGLTAGATTSEVARLVGPYREAVHLREEAVKLAALALEEATIRVRIGGIVSQILFHEGDVVPLGTEIVRVAAGRPGFIVCWMPERAADKVAPGMTASLRTMGPFDSGFAGHVVEVSPELEEVPIRARLSPTVPAWGRRVMIESSPRRPLVLGEAVHVRL
jgi:multidrug resistance efflux pump